MSFPATDCARARESVSAQLDGELPEFELERLEAHLLICPACTAWADGVRDVTLCLREAAFEEPPGRFVLSRLGRGWRAASAVAVASAAAVVATGVFVAQGQHTSLNSRSHLPLVSHVAPKRLVVSRTTRLADGRYIPISRSSTSQVSFKHV